MKYHIRVVKVKKNVARKGWRQVSCVIISKLLLLEPGQKIIELIKMVNMRTKSKSLFPL